MDALIYISSYSLVSIRAMTAVGTADGAIKINRKISGTFDLTVFSIDKGTQTTHYH